MSTRKLIRAVQKLPRQARQLWNWLTKGFFTWLLRNLYGFWRRPSTSTAGFVLPTATLLLLMVTLTVGAMTYRSFSRSEQAIAKREQQVINNSATPAIDRAKAKLEYLFQQDTRMTGVPPSDQLIGMLLNTSYNSVSVTPLGTGVTTDPYTLPDETRLDINNDGNDDNAWSFPSDINGDGTIDPTEYVVYSVLLDDQQDLGGTTYSITDTPNLSKAKSLVTRTGPINTTEAGTQCASARAPEGGWQVVGSSNSDLEKNFQVDVLAVNGNPVNRTVETLEFQQSRRAERGNKWGAWFRYDMIADPESTSTFNWNGAMHTEGSFFFNGPFKMHMISSDHSCLYNEPASEMTMREADAGSDAVGGSGRPAFQGQLVNGNYDGYKSTGDTDAELALMPAIHVFDTDDTPAIPFEDNAAASNADNRKVGLYNGDKSSVKRNAFSLPPVSVGLNPVALFTEEVLEHNVQPGGSSWERRPGYENSIIGQRVLNDNDPRVPNLDDFYRADNRWGPKPRYGSTASMADAGTSLGQNITGNSALTNATTGADGYWERRAIATGLRLIVGQRLELGNAFGWRGDNDPLYPTVNAATGAVDPTGTSYQVAGPGAGGSFKPGLHEMLQFNTLRDNLAAVQGMVIYHYKNAAGTPVACVALTAHPGTQATIANSRTFGLYTSGSGNLKVDFLSGKGTNGWEFSPPDITDAEVGKALKNLATFAGDPEGGSPSFPPAEDSEVHPAPFMSMWGDFSILERGMLSASAADVSTRESSACTLGMLAYNIQTLDKEVNGVASGTPSVPTVQAIQAELGEQLTDRVIDNANFPTFTLADAPKRSLEEWMGALDDSNGLIDGTYTKAQLMEYFVAASQWYQVQRDRTNGFAVELSTNYPFSATASAPYAANAPYPAMCDPNAEFSGVSDEADRFSLAIALCPPTEEDTANNIYQVRYPALYYVFPLVDHGLDDGSGSKYVSNGQVQTAVGGGATAFQAVNLGNVELQPLDIDSSNPSVDDWTLPVASVSPIDGNGFIDASPADLDSEAIRIDYAGTLYKVPFADKGMFDGRENMSLRVLDVDLELLTKNQYSGDDWVPADTNSGAQGIVYAFREDAMREDAIERPDDGAWGDCDSAAEIDNNTCRVIVTDPQDPPRNPTTKVSPKPVDFTPDPFRRAYGFRLKNGTDLSDAKTRNVGMTFITDNTVYVYGDFNLHTTGSAELQEFTALIQDGADYGLPFYKDRDVLNTANFADLTQDNWRPSEILADAVTILSTEFKDGSIEDTFIEPSVEVQGSGQSSYYNQNRLYFTAANAGRFTKDRWNRENPFEDSAAAADRRSPVLVPSTGDYFKSYSNPGDVGVQTDVTSGEYQRIGYYKEANNFLKDRRQYNQIPATATRVNAVIISGINPGRKDQYYGGLENFPRLLEFWGTAANRVPLYISGALFQLNFSTSATGEFEQEYLESRDGTASSKSWNVHYNTPDRRWGYDVALQYQPPGPISSRFVETGSPRSEYYRELPVDDPYMTLLRCA